MAKKERATETVHGWTITERVNDKGRPEVTMMKPDRATLVIEGRAGTDPAILRQRVMVDALAQDVAASPPDDRGLWQERHRDAMRERDQAHARRIADAEVAARYAALESEE